MFYYTVESSHWPGNFEFKSKLEIKEGQYFKITKHSGYRVYPTRFKVLGVSEFPKFSDDVEILEINVDVEPF